MGHAGILITLFLVAFIFICAGSFLSNIASQTIDAELGEGICPCRNHHRLCARMSELMLPLRGIHRMVVMAGMTVFCKEVGTLDVGSKVIINTTCVALVS